MTSTYINSQLSCMSILAMPERAFGRPSHDSEPPSALRISVSPDLRSFRADWQVEKALVNKAFEGSAFESVAYSGRTLHGSFSVTPIPANIKIIANLGITLFGPYYSMPWPNGAPASRAPDSDGEIASWTWDYRAEPTSDQAERYTGVLITGVTIEAGLQNPALRYALTFIAKNRSKDYWSTPNPTCFDWTEPTGNAFLFKNTSIEVDDLRVECESFRLNVTNPVTFDGFDEDGLVSAYAMGAQQAECEVVFVLTEEIRDQVDGWMTDPDFEADIRAIFVHPGSMRRVVGVELPAKTGFIRLSPDYVASPGTPKTDYTRLKDQDIFAIEGTQLDSPLNTTHVECHKVDGSQGPGGVSPSGLWFQSQPSEDVARYHGIRKGFATGARIFSVAHEIGIFRAVPVAKEEFDEGPVRKCRMRFTGLSDGMGSGSQLTDQFNPPLNVTMRP